MIRKLSTSVVIVGMLMGALAGTAAAATGEGSTARAHAKAAAPKHRQMDKDVFRGTVVAISDKELTVRAGKDESKTFLRTDKTEVFRGRDHKVAWSEIEVKSHVTVRFEERDGKRFVTRIHLGWAHVRGKVESVSGNTITIRTRDGKEIKISVSASTRFIERHPKGKPSQGSLKDIHAGMYIAAAGTRDKTGNSFDAVSIVYGGREHKSR